MVETPTSPPDPRMRLWLNSLDLRSPSGHTNWSCTDLFGAEQTIEVKWDAESFEAKRVVRMPQDDPRVQWDVRMIRVRDRWTCERASQGLGVRGWRSFIREEVRQMAVEPTEAVRPRRRLSGLA